MITTKLSKRQQQTLFLLYRFRFLHTNHIKQFFNHKNHHRIHTWLTFLTTQGYILSFSDISSFSTYSKPRVYGLSSKAREILKHNEECDYYLLKNLYREKHASKKFQEHSLFLADIYFSFQKQELEKFHFSTKTDLIAYEYFPHPLPDCYIMTKQQGKRAKRYFLNVFDPNTPWFVFKRRVQQYIRYFEEGEWQRNATSPFPTVLFICMDEKNIKYAKKAVQKGLEEFYESGLQFFVTTKENIQNRNEIVSERLEI